jgi:hypothetical protein
MHDCYLPQQNFSISLLLRSNFVLIAAPLVHRARKTLDASTPAKTGGGYSRNLSAFRSSEEPPF